MNEETTWNIFDYLYGYFFRKRVSLRKQENQSRKVKLCVHIGRQSKETQRHNMNWVLCMKKGKVSYRTTNKHSIGIRNQQNKEVGAQHNLGFMYGKGQGDSGL